MFLATTNKDRNQVTILDTVTYEVVSTLPKNNNEVLCILFAPWDENTLAVSIHRTVQVWDTASGVMQGVFEHTANVYAMCFGKRQDGAVVNDFLVTRCIKKRIRNWNLATKELIFSFNVSSYFEVYVCWYGQLIVSTTEGGHGKGKVCVWDSLTGASINEYETLFERTLADANMNGTSTALQGCRGNDKLLVMVFGMFVTVLSLALDENHISVSSWETPERTYITEIYVFSGDGKRLVCQDYDSSLFVLDVESMTLISQFNLDSAQLNDAGEAFFVNFTGNQLCYCAIDHFNSDKAEWESEWLVIDVETKSVIRSLRGIEVVGFSFATNVILM